MTTIRTNLPEEYLSEHPEIVDGLAEAQRYNCIVDFTRIYGQEVEVDRIVNSNFDKVTPDWNVNSGVSHLGMKFLWWRAYLSHFSIWNSLHESFGNGDTPAEALREALLKIGLQSAYVA